MNADLMAVRSSQECRYDVVSLGEVMLRLDPGEGRIRTARRFEVWEGGGEYNVARGLARCFGQRAAVVTALAENEVGHLIEGLMLGGGVDTSWVRWMPFDGVGRSTRNGLNFTERGFGVRGALGVSDRGHSAASQLRPDDVDWERLFGDLGVRWFHTGGIFAALSDEAAETALAAMNAARRHGTVVSYDLNYRPSLWAVSGGKTQAKAVNRRMAPLVDVMLGNEEDFMVCLGLGLAGGATDLQELPTDAYSQLMASVLAEFPNVQVAASTLRQVRSATINDWSAVAWSRQTAAVMTTERPGLEILDRVGGGDSFASGLIYGLLNGLGLPTALEFGAAHGALAMTTPGDASMATLAEVERLVRGGNARVQR